MSTHEKVNILMVDDQPSKLLSYEVILSELNENLIKAGSGREALEHLLKTDIAVVLMDVSMPVLDGFEATREIRAAAEDVRVLMLTGSNSRADVDRSREVGASGYITKDRIASELVAAIVEVSRRRLP